MRPFKKFVTVRESAIHPQAVGIIQKAYDEENPHVLAIACDRMDDEGESELSNQIRAFLASPSREALVKVMPDAITWLDGNAFFWARENIQASFFAGRGPQVYWHGCKGGDPRVCLFGAQWCRPGNRYDPRRRHRPYSWTVATPTFVAGQLPDDVMMIAEMHTIIAEAVPLVTQNNVLNNWRDGGRTALHAEEMVFSLLGSMLQAPRP